MKAMDRPLVAIVVAIVILLIVAIAFVILEPAPDYMPEGEPEATAYNYLLALFQGDFERAYGYLSPNLPAYPHSLDEFVHEIRQNPWQFGLDRDVSFSVEDVYMADSLTYVTVQERRFSSNDVLSPSYYTHSFEFELINELGEWRILDADRYFSHCWHNPDLCN